MTGEAQSSPSPSEAGFAIGRRKLLAGAGAVGAGVIVAACGSDDDGGSSSEGTEAPAETEASGDGGDGDGGDTSVGTVTFGSNYSDEANGEAIAAAIATTGLDVEINTVEHNAYQENFNTYIQQPDDVVSWFAGYRMRAFANKGVVGDVSDVWASDLDSVMSEGFKSASTGLDGKQYFVPFYFYAWGLHYRKSVFEENGYEIPTTWDEFIALCDQMVADGIIPIAAANGGGWPQMGMFDMINLRTNGYDFHVSLMGGNEDWSGDQVKAVFANWEQLLPYYQPDANGREWQDAATALGDGSAGMYLIGNFLIDQYEGEVRDDIDFFAFPEIDPAYGQDSIEAPIDGFMMAASPENEAGAKALLGGIGQAAAIDAYIGVTPSVVAANSEADTSGYTALQAKAAELVGGAKSIAQFLDRDTDPAFASEVVGKAIQDFLNDPSQIDSILTSVEEKKQTFTFE
jgi:multiple sugar transport system substrate-binding protein